MVNGEVDFNKTALAENGTDADVLGGDMSVKMIGRPLYETIPAVFLSTIFQTSTFTALLAVNLSTPE
jgi:hypothetical protein